MKIISKYKDYYDYLVSVYGRDETIVYDRRKQNLECIDHNSLNGNYLFSICGTYYPVVKTKGRFYFDYKTCPTSDTPRHFHGMKFLSHDQNFLHDWTGKKSLENVNHRKPVLICDTYNGKAIENAIPILSGFGIPSILDAHKIFQDIYAFLGWLKDNPEIPNNQTDKEKVVAHGFDVKRSFRPTIKN